MNHEWPTLEQLDRRIHGWRRLGALVIDGARNVRDARLEFPAPRKRTPQEPEHKPNEEPKP